MLSDQSKLLDTLSKVLDFGKLKSCYRPILHCSSSDVEPFPTLLGLGAGLVWYIKMVDSGIFVVS
jgi:hypothetical protein